MRQKLASSDLNHRVATNVIVVDRARTCMLYLMIAKYSTLWIILYVIPALDAI